MTAYRAPVKGLITSRGVSWSVCAAFLFVIFFPVLFMGRFVFPLEALYRYEPWSITSGDVEIQNPGQRAIALEDATRLALVEKRHFDWNPYAGSGSEFSLLRSGLASPIVFAATGAGSPASLFTWLVLLKFISAFFFAYRWLRTEMLARIAAAFGAVIVSASGIVSAEWFSAKSAAIAIVPALFWAMARIARRTDDAFDRPVAGSLAMTFVIAASIGVAADRPAALAIVAASLMIVVAHRSYRAAWPHLVLLVVTLALLARPFVPPPSGDATGDWTSRIVSWFDSSRPEGEAWAFASATLYVGIVALVLAFFGTFQRDRRALGWGTLAAVSFAFTAFASGGAASGARWLLPFGIGFLAAAGVDRFQRGRKAFRFASFVAGGAAVLELAFFAANHLPYARRADTRIERSETVQKLQNLSRERAFRIVPFFDYLPPDASVYVGLEDVRARNADATTAALVARVPGITTRSGRVEADSLATDLGHPLLGFLSGRFFVEHKRIDILRWRINEASTPLGVPGEKVMVRRGTTMTTFVRAERATYSVEFYARSADRSARRAIEVRAWRPESGEVVHRALYSASQLEAMEKVYVPLWPRVVDGNLVAISIAAIDADAEVLRGTRNGEFLAALVHVPLVPYGEYVDGRIYENIAALPRFFATWQLTRGEPRAAFEVAVGAEDEQLRQRLGFVRKELRRVKLRVERRGSDFSVGVESDAPFLLASSEKISDGLRVRIDGRETNVIRINSVFAAVAVPPGRHRVEFVRAIDAGDRRLLALLAAVGVAAVIIDLVRRARRERTDRQTAPSTRQ